MARRQQQQRQEQEQEQQQQESGGTLTLPRLAIVAVLVCSAAVIWQGLFGSSEGIVFKPDAVYDFIIIGGGTAGSVLAARLSETQGYKVLLIEAGGEEPWLSSIPLAAPLLQQSRYDWQHKTLPQKYSSEALENKVSNWPRGRLLGGTGSINYNIHMFGSPQDYDIWEHQYGAHGWGFKDIIKFANKAECRRLRPKLFKQDQCTSEPDLGEERGCNDNSSTDGQNHIRQHQDSVQCYDPALRSQLSSSTLTDTFLAAGKELGLPVGDLNDDIDYGLMPGSTTVYKGKRWSSVKGYLRPALGRPNLHVLLHTHVTKVIWEGKRAVGVHFLQWDNPRLNGSVYARGEVISSAGAILTPAILTHSGIGPRVLLDKLKIPVVLDRPGVGSNLQDHLNLPIYVSLQEPVSLNIAKMRTFTNIWEYFFHGGKGDLGRAAIEGLGVLKIEKRKENTEKGKKSNAKDGKKKRDSVTKVDTGLGQPEIAMILFNMGAVDKHLYSTIANIKLDYFETTFPSMDNQSSEGFIFLVTCLHPKSRGHVVVTSKDPQYSPIIDPNYLSHPYDTTCMRDAFKMAVKLTRTKAFQKLGASVHLPRYQECIGGDHEETDTTPDTSPDKNTDKNTDPHSHIRYRDYVDCLVRVGGITGYHPLGTARMGPLNDSMAVVDSTLSVIGAERLRIVDASVMPTQISGTPNSAIIVIAEKAAHMIKERWGNGSSLVDEKICSSSPDCEEKLLESLSSAPRITTLSITTFIIISFIYYSQLYYL